MLTRKHAILAAAVLGVVPLAAQAVTITFQFDPADLMVSAAQNGPYVAPGSFAGASLGGTTDNPIVNVPLGTWVEYGLDAEVQGDTGATSGNALGLAAFETGITNSAGNTTLNQVFPGNTVVESWFTTASGKGSADGFGGVSSGTGTNGNFNAGGQTSTANTTNGANAFTEIYKTQKVKPNGANTSSGSTTLALTSLNIALQYVINGANSSGGSHTYYNKTFVTGTDVLSALPTLQVVYASASTTANFHSIISLTAGNTPVAGYGAPDGTITMVGGNGKYVPQFAAPFTNQATGSVAVSNWNPVTDQEIYALKLSLPGGVTDSNVVADINGGSGNLATNTSSGSVTASLLTGVFTSLFPGYDILLTTTGFTAGAGGTAEVGFDFSTLGGQQNPADNGVIVTGVAAVPEPATAAGIVLGAAGLLLGRRRNKALAA